MTRGYTLKRAISQKKNKKTEIPLISKKNNLLIFISLTLYKKEKEFEGTDIVLNKLEAFDLLKVIGG